MRPPLLATLLSVVAAALSACGGEQADEPADLVPAGAPIYLEASFDSDAQVANAKALIAELGRVPLLGATLDPEALVATALERSAAEAGVEFSYADDVEPWLGDRLALAFLTLEGFESQDESSDPEDFVLILETTDEDAARDSIRRLLEADTEAGLEEGEVAGKPTLSAPDEDLYIAFADGFVVLGPRLEAIERSLAAPDEPLSESDELATAGEGLPDERLGFAYVDLDAAIDYAVATGGADEDSVRIADAFYGEGLREPLSLALTAAESGVALDVASGLRGLGLPALGQSELVAQAPADALAAVGLGDVGAQLRELLDRASAAASEGGEQGFDLEQVSRGFEAQAGVPLDDALAALGDGAVWVRGAPPDRYAVGIELVSPEPEVAGRLLDAVAGALRDSGYVVREFDRPGDGFSAAGDPLLTGGAEFGVVEGAVEGDRVSVLLATERAALADRQRAGLAGERSFSAAEAALGDAAPLVAYADLGAILGLASEQTSAFDVVIGESAPEQLILEYLAGKLGYLASGIREDGERTIQRLVAGLR